MAYTPKNSPRGGKPFQRSSARTSARPSRSYSRDTKTDKKPRWVPRSGASRPFAQHSERTARTPAPFPQKPPYRPNGPIATRAPFVRPSPKPRYTPKPKVSKTQSTTTSWGGVADWYDKHLEGMNTYHEKVILPNLLRLVEPKKDEHILDLASGQGFFARKFNASGARLTGVDISPELIRLAKNESGEAITYHIGSAEHLNMLKDGQFDKTIIVLAIQNIAQVGLVCAEAARVTKAGGTFHIVMNHPAFRIPKQSHWGYDDKEKVQYRRVDQYLSESRSEIEMHPGMKDSPTTISFHRPLQYYIKALVKAGFVIDRFEEWISHKESDSGPRAKAENRARKEIPLFLYMRAKKIG